MFRHGSRVEQNTVTVKNLDPNLKYTVFRAPKGEKIIYATGKELEETGFKVILTKLYDGALYEISSEK